MKLVLKNKYNMKLNQAVDNVAKMVISKHFIPENELGIICRYPFRTKDTVTCIGVQDMLDEKLNINQGETDKARKIHVEVRDFYFRESCEWWCSNILLCFVPIATCKVYNCILDNVNGPYYEIVVLRV